MLAYYKHPVWLTTYQGRKYVHWRFAIGDSGNSVTPLPETSDQGPWNDVTQTRPTKRNYFSAFKNEWFVSCPVFYSQNRARHRSITRLQVSSAE